MIQEFHDRDGQCAHEDFQHWRRQHRRGYYINFRRQPPNLHISQCRHAGYDTNTVKDIEGSLTATRKVCSPTPEELVAWCVEHSVNWARCKDCVTEDLYNGLTAAWPGPTIESAGLAPVAAESYIPVNIGQLLGPDWAADLAIFNRIDLGPTEKDALIKARRGQGVFRKKVIALEKQCRFTNVDDVEHLRASHIKPWNVASDFEKLDGNNGILLAPHIDHLFDGGYISFTDEGVVIKSHLCSESVFNAWGIDQSRNVGPFRPAQRVYLEFHRENQLKL